MILRPVILAIAIITPSVDLNEHWQVMTLAKDHSVYVSGRGNSCKEAIERSKYKDDCPILDCQKYPSWDDRKFYTSIECIGIYPPLVKNKDGEYEVD